MVFRYSKGPGTAMSCQLPHDSSPSQTRRTSRGTSRLERTLGRTLVPTRCARGTLSSTESAAYRLQQAKPAYRRSGEPKRRRCAVLAHSSLSPSETAPPSYEQAGKDGGGNPKNISRIKAFKKCWVCVFVCVCQWCKQYRNRFDSLVPVNNCLRSCEPG
jgi:hypothetical protein